MNAPPVTTSSTSRAAVAATARAAGQGRRAPEGIAMNTATNLDRLAVKAEAVAAEAREADAAREQLEAAQAALLERVIDTARPALRAIGTRPLVAAEQRYHARAVRIDGARPAPCLFVREDGALFVLADPAAGQSAEVTEYATPAEAIAAGWNRVDRYVETLAEAVDKAAGTRAGTIAANRARAEQLGAVVALLATKPKANRNAKGGAR
jgi:hypothetical protein